MKRFGSRPFEKRAADTQQDWSRLPGASGLINDDAMLRPASAEWAAYWRATSAAVPWVRWSHLRERAVSTVAFARAHPHGVPTTTTRVRSLGTPIVHAGPVSLHDGNRRRGRRGRARARETGRRRGRDGEGRARSRGPAASSERGYHRADGGDEVKRAPPTAKRARMSRRGRRAERTRRTTRRRYSGDAKVKTRGARPTVPRSSGCGVSGQSANCTSRGRGVVHIVTAYYLLLLSG